MKKKILILYAFENKTQVEKTQALRTMFGYRDKSNYNYQYEREGELAKIGIIKPTITEEPIVNMLIYSFKTVITENDKITISYEIIDNSKVADPIIPVEPIIPIVIKK